MATQLCLLAEDHISKDEIQMRGENVSQLSGAITDVSLRSEQDHTRALAEKSRKLDHFESRSLFFIQSHLCFFLFCFFLAMT